MWILLSEKGLIKRVSVINYNDGCLEVPDNTDVFLNPSGYRYANNQFLLGYEIPISSMVDYVMISECPKDHTLVRHLYWIGEHHKAEQCFTIDLLALHFNTDGTRNQQYDCKTWTRADKGMMMDNPLDPGTQVDEYEFFVSMVGGTFMPELVQLGIYAAEDVLNIRIYENSGN